MLETSLPNDQKMLYALTCTVFMPYHKCNINFFYVNTGKKVYWEIRTFYEAWVLKPKRHSTGGALTRETFCGVWLYLTVQKRACSLFLSHVLYSLILAYISFSCIVCVVWLVVVSNTLVCYWSSIIHFLIACLYTYFFSCGVTALCINTVVTHS